MAKNIESKTPAAPAAPEPKTMTQAQDAFASYKKQVGAAQASYGFAAGQAGLGWASFPPSVAMLPQPAMQGGFYPAMVQPGGFTGESLADRLGWTLRLGVDGINAVLAGGIRVLTGFSGLAYAVDEHGRSSSNCGCCSCCDPCETECGGYDCCCLFGEKCCHPSVGNCC